MNKMVIVFMSVHKL